MKDTIKLINVSKKLKSGFQLDGITFDIPQGFVTGLIGNNGAGKSTIIKTITTAVLGDSGKIESQTKLTPKDVGVVFDECPYPEYLRCIQLAGIFEKMFPGWDSQKYLAYLSEYGIDGKKRVKELSRGMSMKLQVAVAFSHPTRLLLLDEPTAGMDPASRDEFLDLLRGYMQDEDHSVLISSHITSDLEKIADFLVYVKDGKIIAKGEMNAFLEKYGIMKCGKSGHPLDKRLIVCSRHNEFGSEYLVRDKNGIREAYPELTVDDASLEEIMIFLSRGDLQ